MLTFAVIAVAAIVWMGFHYHWGAHLSDAIAQFHHAGSSPAAGLQAHERSTPCGFHSFSAAVKRALPCHPRSRHTAVAPHSALFEAHKIQSLPSEGNVHQAVNHWLQHWSHNFRPGDSILTAHRLPGETYDHAYHRVAEELAKRLPAHNANDWYQMLVNFNTKGIPIQDDWIVAPITRSFYARGADERRASRLIGEHDGRSACFHRRERRAAGSGNFGRSNQPMGSRDLSPVQAPLAAGLLHRFFQGQTGAP